MSKEKRPKLTPRDPVAHREPVIHYGRDEDEYQPNPAKKGKTSVPLDVICERACLPTSWQDFALEQLLCKGFTVVEAARGLLLVPESEADAQIKFLAMLGRHPAREEAAVRGGRRKGAVARNPDPKDEDADCDPDEIDETDEASDDED